MDYSDMKATKSDKGEGVKKALEKLAGGSQSNKSSGTKKNTSSSSSSKKKSSGTKKSTSSSSSKRSTSSAIPGAPKRKRGRPRKNESVLGTIVEAVTEVVTPDAPKPSSREIKGSSIKKARKNVALILGIVFLIVGIGLGFMCSHFVFAGDTYEMVCYSDGQADITICADPEVEGPKYYTELGVKCIAFGKDCSKDYTVKYYYRNDLTQDEVEVERVDETVTGIYYAVYTAPSKKYGTVKLIRNIIVIGGEDAL